MLKEIIKSYVRASLIEFISGQPVTMVSDGGRPDEDEEVDDAEGMSPVQQLQVEEALNALMMQLPIYVTKEINDELFNDVVTKLHDILFLRQRIRSLQERYPDDKMIKLVEMNKPVRVVITTPGGLVREAFAIYDAIQLLKDDGAIVETIGSGKVMSAGTLLLSAGSKGHRKMTKNTTLMVHDISSGFIGTMPQMENQIEETKRLRAHFFRLFRDNTDISEKELSELLDRKVDQFFLAEDCLSRGIVDEII